MRMLNMATQVLQHPTLNIPATVTVTSRAATSPVVQGAVDSVRRKKAEKSGATSSPAGAAAAADGDEGAASAAGAPEDDAAASLRESKAVSSGKGVAAKALAAVAKQCMPWPPRLLPQPTHLLSRSCRSCRRRQGCRCPRCRPH